MAFSGTHVYLNDYDIYPLLEESIESKRPIHSSKRNDTEGIDDLIEKFIQIWPYKSYYMT